MPPALIPTLSYHPFERLRPARPVERVPYIIERCRGKRVLDLGAYDETEIEKAPHPTWVWLHAQIASVAGAVMGVDASAHLPAEGMVTQARTRIVRHNVEAGLGDMVREFRPDIIVAGELIEHTPDALGWLSRLAHDAPGVAFLATTPNATSLINILLALLGRESNHKDHLHVYSYKTLATMAARIPLEHATLTPYYYNPNIFMRELLSASAPLATLLNAALVKPVTYLLPMTAAGWILEGRFPARP